jgi:hypothetical protein
MDTSIVCFVTKRHIWNESSRLLLLLHLSKQPYNHNTYNPDETLQSLQQIISLYELQQTTRIRKNLLANTTTLTLDKIIYNQTSNIAPIQEKNMSQ